MIIKYLIKNKNYMRVRWPSVLVARCVTGFFAAPLKTRLLAWTPEVAVRLCAQMAAMTDWRMRSSNMADHLAPK